TALTTDRAAEAASDADDRAHDPQAFDARAFDDDATDAAFAVGEAPTVPPVEPAWSRGAKAIDETTAAMPSTPSTAVPRWHDPLTVSLDEAAIAAEVAPLNPAPPGLARIDLAKAYLDMGDRDTARSLLREGAALGDRASRDEAVRLLRDLT
ncbi:MAG: hypothetical protein IT473_02840, partial [Lysobacter sp.]|nr:hypothetical protein [Lysobacter sp.]